MNKSYKHIVKNIWFSSSNKIRFFIVGCANAAVSYVFSVLFCLLLVTEKYQFALILSWICSSIISFSAQKYLVFESKGNWFKEYAKCCTTWSLSYLLNALFLEMLVNVLGINVFIAQIFSTLCVAIFTYILFKRFAFKSES